MAYCFGPGLMARQWHGDLDSRLPYCPVPSHAGQITGVQLCTFPAQAQPGPGSRPPPLQSWQRSLRFMIAPERVASHPVGFTR